jgi:hypothetical protein
MSNTATVVDNEVDNKFSKNSPISEKDDLIAELGRQCCALQADKVFLTARLQEALSQGLKKPDLSSTRNIQSIRPLAPRLEDPAFIFDEKLSNFFDLCSNLSEFMEHLDPPGFDRMSNQYKKNCAQLDNHLDSLKNIATFNKFDL